ncbi:MAG: 8-oxo-dGTP diphosphatase MutT [Anaerovoracaceae bacterium]|nr:8-oxo-dGTP diphosphatase MutT [Anaerovoracaceae bacterium]
MKTIHVSAAIFIRNNRVFATQRGYGEFKDYWEFPGGKIENGEIARQALIREIKEELGAEVRVGDLFASVEYDYPEFHLSMDCFLCEVASGEIELLEHEAARWLAADELDSVGWLPADLEVVEELKARLVSASEEPHDFH